MVSTRQLVVLLICGALIAYFGFHTSYGRHGLEQRARLIERSRLLEREIAALETVRGRLARDVRLLDDPTPDPDLVEELARGQLGFARPGERILVDAPRPAR